MSSSAQKDSEPGELSIQFWAKTDVGRVRKHNEDSYFADERGRFFVVADGMGGHAAGEVASRIAADESKRLLDEAAGDDGFFVEGECVGAKAMTTLLARVATRANDAVLEHAASDRKLKGMGTTLEVAVPTATGLWIGHVGDSRTYRIRGNEVSQLTEDQTLVRQLSAEQRANLGPAVAQLQHVLSNAIGAREDIEAEVVHHDLAEGDLLLLCSDGLYEYFPREAELGEIILMDGPEKGLARLVELAIERGGKDNITGVLAQVQRLPADKMRVLEEEELAEIAAPSPAMAKSKTSPPEQKQPIVEPVLSAADQDYGIDNAIALVRVLPNGPVEVVVEVMRKTLASAQVYIAPIIEDAEKKQVRLQQSIERVQSDIADHQEQLAEYRREIEELEADREETLSVKEQLERVLQRS